MTEQESTYVRQLETALRKIASGTKNVSKNRSYGGCQLATLKRMEMVEIAREALKQKPDVATVTAWFFSE